MQKYKASSTHTQNQIKNISFGIEREQASEMSEELSGHRLQLHFPSSTTKKHKGSLQQIGDLPSSFRRGGIFPSGRGEAENKI